MREREKKRKIYIYIYRQTDRQASETDKEIREK